MQTFKNILVILPRQGQEDNILEQLQLLLDHHAAQVTLAMPSAAKEVWYAFSENYFDVQPMLMNVQDFVTEIELKQKEYMQRVAQKLQDKVQVDSWLIEGEFFIDVIQRVQAHQHDIVMVMANLDNGLHWFGSDVTHLLRKCPCPVWVIDPAGRVPYARVAVALDLRFSEQTPGKKEFAKQLLDIGYTLAKWQKAKLHIIHAWQPFTQEIEEHLLQISPTALEPYRQTFLEKLRANLDVFLQMTKINKDDVVVHLLPGQAEPVIKQILEQEQLDVLVMGTVGRTGVKGFFIGNTAEHLIHHIRSAVLAIKPPGFVSPV